MFYFGAHNDINKGLIPAAQEILDAGGNIIQIMLTDPGQRSLFKLENKDLINFKHFLEKNSMAVVIHSSYMHNIARDWDEQSWWLLNIEKEIQTAHVLNAIGLVLHLGKQLSLSTAEAYNNMYTSLIHINNKTKEKYSNIPILLETSTGQGSEMCYKLEDLSYFYKKISKSSNKQLRSRIKLCLDTCHVFSAGYDISSKEGANLFLETFEELIGLRHIKLVHFNDSRVPLGEQLDRHQNIGKGYIGLEGLIRLFKVFKKLNLPMVLETPDPGFKKEIKKMLKLTNIR